MDLPLLNGGYRDHIIDEIYEDAMKDFYNDRTLIINDVITDDILDDIQIHILLWNKDDKGLPADKRQPIKLIIDSDGGSVIATNNLINLIECSKTPIYGYVYSMAASAASSILIACHKRYAFKHSVILLHDGSLAVNQTSSKARDTMKFFDKIDDITRELVLSKTNITEQEYEDNKDREQYFFAAEAKEKGIIDYIIGVDVDLEDIL